MRGLLAALLLLAVVVPAHAQVADSTGQNVGMNIGYADTVYSSTWSRVGGKPETATRWPSWSEVTGKPTTAVRWPSWNEVSSKPSTFPTTWGSVKDKPSSYPTKWSSVSGKPSSFPSSWNSISGKPSSFPTTWGNVSGRPSTFPTSWSKISGIPSIIADGTSSLDARYARKSTTPNGKECSSGKYVKGINSNGSLKCATLPSGGGGGGNECAPGSYWNGHHCTSIGP